jgi:flagellum-specific ATP synthase
MNNLVTPQHFSLVQRFKRIYAHYQRNHDLISVGAYVHGSDPLLDEGILLYPHMEHFLKQGMFDADAYTTSLDKLSNLFGANGSIRAVARNESPEMASNG